MSAWSEILEAVEPLEDLAFDSNVVERLAASEKTLPGIHFYTPTFKSYATSEIKDCGRSAWPAISITGGDCKLNCDHCKAKILEPMIPARSPEDLWRAVNGIVEQGAGGMLLTGGSNHRNEVEYDRYYPTIRRIKDEFPHFRIAMHTALVDGAIAARMADAGIDAAMMDVIGAQDTITQVYHLRRSVDDFERALEALTATSMKVVPHIVIGLHYGQLLGEWNALEIVARHRPSALVLVVVMPTYAAEPRPFAAPDPHEVGQFFWGCARDSAGCAVAVGLRAAGGVGEGPDRCLCGHGRGRWHGASKRRHGGACRPPRPVGTRHARLLLNCGGRRGHGDRRIGCGPRDRSGRDRPA